MPMRSRASTSRLLRFRPQRRREHAAHPREAVRVPLQERAQHRFRVAMRPEPMPQRLQFVADFAVVVDFAVERDGGVAVVADDRLVAAGQIDDLQAHRAQGRDAAFEDAVLVGPAMVERFRDPVGNPPAHVSR